MDKRNLANSVGRRQSQFRVTFLIKFRLEKPPKQHADEVVLYNSKKSVTLLMKKSKIVSKVHILKTCCFFESCTCFILWQKITRKCYCDNAFWHSFVTHTVYWNKRLVSNLLREKTLTSRRQFNSRFPIYRLRNFKLTHDK